MIPQAHCTISVEILGLEQPLLLRGPEARSFVRRIEKIWGRSGAGETDLRIRIRHAGAGSTGDGEMVGAILDNGSLRFGRAEARPIPAFQEWMVSVASGQPQAWPPQSTPH